MQLTFASYRHFTQQPFRSTCGACCGDLVAAKLAGARRPDKSVAFIVSTGQPHNSSFLPAERDSDCVTGLKHFNHLAPRRTTRNTTDRYIPNAFVCLVNLGPSKPRRRRSSPFFFLFLQPAESIRGNITLLRRCFSPVKKARRSTPFVSFSRSLTPSRAFRVSRARAREYFYSRFLHALFAVYVALIFTAVKGERI